ncbi:hypothetical protein ACU4GD_11955 [Cupriavidus basilensis]
MKMEAEFPTERWFWFDPPFHPNQSVLLHRQPDNVWRIDFQLGWDADPVAGENAGARDSARRRRCSVPMRSSSWNGSASIPSPACAWTASATATCCLPATPRIGVSPFGAARRQQRRAGCGEPRLEAGASCSRARRRTACSIPYASEREYAADENIRNSTRSTDFITPKSARQQGVPRCRAEPVEAAAAFAQQLVEARTALPAVGIARLAAQHARHPANLQAAWCRARPAWMRPYPGEQGPGWLLPQLGGQFTALVFGAPDAGDRRALQSLGAAGTLPLKLVVVDAGEACTGSRA